MDKKIEQQDPTWKIFIASKQEGGVRNTNMTNFIAKSNVFQNDSTLEKQRQTLQSIETKLGKKQEEEEEQKIKVDFRTEPLKPKQSNQERDMFLIAKPLIQEYTTLNIVSQPQIQTQSHRISADLHKNLEGLIKRSENLVMEKKQQTIVPNQGQINQQKVINDRFLDHIRKIDQSFSPMKFNPIPNTLNTEQKKDTIKHKTESKKEFTEQISQPKTKYDRDFDFKQFNQGRLGIKQVDQLQDIQLPQTINEIMQLKQAQNKKDSKNDITQYQFQNMSDNEYLFMEDMLEQNNFDRLFKEQAIEVNKQTKKLENSYPINLGDQKHTFSYVPQVHQSKPDIDMDNLNFNSILQIASGNVPQQQLKDMTNKYDQSHSTLPKVRQSKMMKSSPLQSIQSTKVKNPFIEEEQSTKKTKYNLTPVLNDEEDDEDEEVDSQIEESLDNEFQSKCVQTTPRGDNLKSFICKDEGVQISSLAIDEEIRNIPRIGVILSQIDKIKKQYSMAAERADKAKLKTLLNNRLLDLINLILNGENFKGKNVGEAVQFLLSKNKAQLKEASIDGISKLELLYIFLTEYKTYKNMTDQELNDYFSVVKSNQQFLLVPKSQKQNMKEGFDLTKNKRKTNALAYHFRTPVKSSPKRYAQPTFSSKKFVTEKKSKSPMQKTPVKMAKKVDENKWLSRTLIELDDINHGWTKVS